MEGKKGRSTNWFTRLSRGKKIALCISGVIICLAASAGFYVTAKLGKVKREVIPKEKIVVNDLEEDVGVGYTNFAVFGVDSREGEMEKGTRTDCLIVASLNNETKEVRLVSVYRDSFLDLSDGTLQKCNAAYSYGGAEQAINMLNMNLDLGIQDFVTVDFTAVSDVVDLLGGIEIEIQEEEVQYINEFIDETGAVAGKTANHITTAGLQTLDGVQATTYARIRSTAGSDFTRTERQRRVIEKIAEKAVKSDLVTINKIIDQVFPKIKTSLSITEILNYAKSFAKYKIAETTGFPMEKTTDTIPGKGSIVIPTDLLTNVKMLHEFLYGTVDYQPSAKVQSIDSAIKAELGTSQSDSSAEQSGGASGETQENQNYNNSYNNNSNGNDSSEESTGEQVAPEEPVTPQEPETPQTPEEPQQPVEPESPPTEPTDPPTEPTDPPTEPTDPPTEPTDPPTEPTDPPTDIESISIPKEKHR